MSFSEACERLASIDERLERLDRGWLWRLMPWAEARVIEIGALRAEAKYLRAVLSLPGLCIVEI